MTNLAKLLERVCLACDIARMLHFITWHWQAPIHNEASFPLWMSKFWCCAPPGCPARVPPFNGDVLLGIAGEGHKAAKERVKQEKLARVAKVIGLSKLKSKYESHEAKRNLCAQYDLFIADDRILPSLPKLIGGEHCQS